ncbi:MAG: hypothetical protein BGP04_11630 [Rhizobiales bacterium 62-17]|nr:MAG: hypothetical protein BGP04_11630 [Rhizobiales bacterium 62-17]
MAWVPLTQAQTQRDGAAAGGALSGGAAGAAGGAIVGGPVGAVVGGIVGATVGGSAGAALTPDDQRYIHGYVVERDIDNVAISEPLARGRSLPRSVRTYVIEGDQRYHSLRYARVNNQYLLVDSRGNIVGAIE